MHAIVETLYVDAPLRCKEMQNSLSPAAQHTQLQSTAFQNPLRDAESLQEEGYAQLGVAALLWPGAKSAAGEGRHPF